VKTLFFALVCFLLNFESCFADDQIAWCGVTTKFPVKALLLQPATLKNLQKALFPGSSMTAVVAQCGLPSAEFDPAIDSPRDHGIVMSGGIIYRDGFLLGEEGFLRFRYELPGEGQVCISTDKEQRVQYALFETKTGKFQYLVGKPTPTSVVTSTRSLP